MSLSRTEILALETNVETAKQKTNTIRTEAGKVEAMIATCDRDITRQLKKKGYEALARNNLTVAKCAYDAIESRLEALTTPGCVPDDAELAQLTEIASRLDKAKEEFDIEMGFRNSYDPEKFKALDHHRSQLESELDELNRALQLAISAELTAKRDLGLARGNATIARQKAEAAEAKRQRILAGAAEIAAEKRQREEAKAEQRRIDAERQAAAQQKLENERLQRAKRQSDRELRHVGGNDPLFQKLAAAPIQRITTAKPRPVVAPSTPVVKATPKPEPTPVVVPEPEVEDVTEETVEIVSKKEPPPTGQPAKPFNPVLAMIAKAKGLEPNEITTSGRVIVLAAK